MKRYKLTTQDMKTRPGERNETRWVVGEWVEATGDLEQDLCSDAYIHWYDDPLLAVLLNPVHACLDNPRLWEVEVTGDTKTDGQLKGGSRRVRLVREIDVPRITIEMCVTFAILCAKAVYKDREWNTWADRWLSGEDRTTNAAAYAAAGAANAADAAGYAADAAARAAALRAVARAARRRAAYAARAVVDADAVSAADAAVDAAYAAVDIDLKKIATEATR